MFNTIFVHPLFNLLAAIYAYLPLHDFGLAVIILTVLVRLILWPLVTKQLHSQRALQRLQPELMRIKSEAGGDRAKEGQMTMELYKEKGINPFSSFVPILIQLPVFIALYAVLTELVKPGEIAQLAYPFIASLGPIAEIISGKASFHPSLLGLIDLTKPSPLLAVLAALAQFIQTKQLTPKHTTNDAQAQITKGMTYLFPGITLVLGLTWPSALTLYWATSSLVAVLQQTIVLRRDVEEMESIIDASPDTKVTTSTSLSAGKPAGKKKKGKARTGRA